MKTPIAFTILRACAGARVPAVRTSTWVVAMLVAFALMFSGTPAGGVDFVVSGGDHRTYTINGVRGNAVLTLERGETYTFQINIPYYENHPFLIRSTGVINNNTDSGGIITYTVPMAASNYSYICSYHGFGNAILTVAPTNFRVRSVTMGSNLVLKSTGPTNYDVLPEFKTDLRDTNWFALTVQTNSAVSGAYETICGRPPGSNFFFRIKSVLK